MKIRIKIFLFEMFGCLDGVKIERNKNKKINIFLFDFIKK